MSSSSFFLIFLIFPQDCLLMELLEWFKGSFFTWFDSPGCPVCHNKMKMVGSLPPTQDDLLWGGSRVEGFACSVSVCQPQEEQFSRALMISTALQL